MKRLIVNADDFGLTEGVSRGILEAHQKGIVTSTTAMMGSPYAAEAVRKVIPAAPRLGLGVHLTLSGTGCAVLPPAAIPSLVREDGRFFPLADWLARVDQFDEADIEREMTAQCARFVEVAGRPPDHLDAHHDAAFRHPAALRTLYNLAHHYGIPIRNVDPVNLFGGQIPTPLKQVVDTRASPPRPARLDESFYDKTATLGDFLLILTNLPEDTTTEIMCHPGYVDAALASSYAAKREDELKVLTHASVREVIRAEGIELINYADLNVAR